jgi:two-component system sensor histidine kinase MtrB
VNRTSLAERTGRGVAQLRQLRVELSDAFDAVWRRSLQLRVVISTLALSLAVVLVLGFILQTQIAGQLLQGKETDAVSRLETSRIVLERDLSGVDPDRDGAAGELNNALSRLSSTSLEGEAAPAAGEFFAVLAASRSDISTELTVGRIEDVPADMRDAGRRGCASRSTPPCWSRASPPRCWWSASRCGPRPGRSSSTCCSRWTPSAARWAWCRAP